MILLLDCYSQAFLISTGPRWNTKKKLAGHYGQLPNFYSRKKNLFRLYRSYLISLIKSSTDRSAPSSIEANVPVSILLWSGTTT